MRCSYMAAFLVITAALLFTATSSRAAPGEPDTSFGDNGIVLLDSYPTDAGSNEIFNGCDLLQDGDSDYLIMAGYTTISDKRWSMISALRISGRYHRPFGTRGMVLQSLGSQGKLNDVYVDSGKNITACGTYGSSSLDSILMRMDKDGKPVSSFGTFGTAIVGVKGVDDGLNAVAVFADGSAIAVGYAEGPSDDDFLILKVDSKGTPDKGFGIGGFVAVDFGADDRAEGLAVDKHGNITVVGSSTSGFTSDVALARLSNKGALDDSFSFDGKVLFDWSDLDFGKDVSLLSSGKILVAGITHTTSTDFYIARLSESGSLDIAYGSGGKTLVDFSDGTDACYALHTYADGSASLMGYTTIADGSIQPCVAAVDDSGGLDESFSSDGKVIFDTEYSGFLGLDGLVRDNGDILVAGYATKEEGDDTDFGFVEFSSTGYYNPDWDLQSIDRKIKEDEYGKRLELLPDGSCVGLCGTGDSTADFKITADGELDYSFTLNGYSSFGYNLNDIQVLDDDSLYLGGTYHAGDDQSFALVHHIPGDISYGVFEDFIDDNEECYALASMADERPYFVGYAGDDIAVTRRLLSLSADYTFGTEGLVTTSYGDSCRARSGVVLADGSLVVGGNVHHGGSSSFLFVKYNSNGALDTDFGTDGFTEIPYGGADTCYGIAATPDGKIIGCGKSIGKVLFVQLNADGSVDTSFGASGLAIFPYDGSPRSYSVRTTGSGKILACGHQNDNPTIWCLNSDGTLDSSFGTGGIATYPEYGAFNELEILPDGRIRAIGYADSEAGDTDILFMQIQGTAAVVNTPPTAVDDTATTEKNTDATLNVLSNDTDADGDTLSLQSVTAPDHGTAVISADSIVYSPEPDYTGTDSFDYIVSDGNAGTDTGTVDITVTDPGGAAEDLNVTGWWYTPGEGGTGLSVGMSADKSTIFLAWYVYNSTGKAVWYVAWCAETDDNTFTGDVRRYVGDPLGAFTDEGDITLAFTSENAGTVSWNMSLVRANPGSKAIEKYMPTLDSGADDPVGFNGWWADSLNQPATGIFVEARGDDLYLGWYHYRDDGTPVWKVMGGFLDPDGFNPATGIYTADVMEISGGQTIGGDYQAPVIPDTGTTGTLTFTPDGSSMTFNCDGKVYNLSPYTISMP